MGLDFLAVDNFDFTRKMVKKKLGEKLVKMLGFCQNRISGQKCDFSNSVQLKVSPHQYLDFHKLRAMEFFHCYP